MGIYTMLNQISIVTTPESKSLTASGTTDVCVQSGNHENGKQRQEREPGIFRIRHNILALHKAALDIDLCCWCSVCLLSLLSTMSKRVLHFTQFGCRPYIAQVSFMLFSSVYCCYWVLYCLRLFVHLYFSSCLML